MSPRGCLRGGLFVCRHLPIGRRPHVTTPHSPLSSLRRERRRQCERLTQFPFCSRAAGGHNFYGRGVHLKRSSQPKLIGNLRVIFLAGILGALISGTSVSAADYSVDFGVDSVAGRDAGSLTCLFDQICHARMESLGLRISVSVPLDNIEHARIQLSGNDEGCCYFRGAADAVFVDRRKPLSRVPFFRGSRPRGGLFVENERAGILYLRFSPRRDPRRRLEKDTWNQNGKNRTKTLAAVQFDGH